MARHRNAKGQFTRRRRTTRRTRRYSTAQYRRSRRTTRRYRRASHSSHSALGHSSSKVKPLMLVLLGLGGYFIYTKMKSSAPAISPATSAAISQMNADAAAFNASQQS